MRSSFRQKDEIPPELSEAASGILKSSERLSKLIEELGELANIELGNYMVKREIIHLKSLIEEIIEDFETKIKRKKLKVKTLVSPEHYVESDSLLLYRILANLVSNAVKYSLDGGNIEINAVEKDDESRYRSRTKESESKGMKFTGSSKGFTGGQMQRNFR